MDRIIDRSSVGLSESELEVLLEQVSILAKPPSRLRVAGARLRNEAPEVARVIEPPQVHQLVDQDVFADGLGHQDETPVETDVTGRRA